MAPVAAKPTPEITHHMAPGWDDPRMNRCTSAPAKAPPMTEPSATGRTYLAASDVRRAKIHGRCEARTGIAPFDRLVNQVMSQPPYCSAQRVFWIVDNGSSHRGKAGRQRLQDQWPNLIVVHTTIHASWLNQVEIYFSVLQRKALMPNDFASLDELEERLLLFQGHYEKVAKPFEWKFTRRELHSLMARIDRREFCRKAA